MRLPQLILYPLLLATSLCAQQQFQILETEDKILSPEITEASGLAISPTNKNFLWVINDSGNENRLHLLDTQGNDKGSISISTTTNRDWEDLASFKHNGISYLLIADTGDNFSRRDSTFLHIIREPKLPSGNNILHGETKPAWSIPFTFEGGPRDCEAVAVDTATDEILLISKRTKPPELHTLPLIPKKGEAQITKKIGTIRTISPRFKFFPYVNLPTGMDISQDGSLMVINTYCSVYLLAKNGAKNWQDTLTRDPIRIGAHSLPQAETVAISDDKSTIYLTSEGKNQPLLKFVETK